MTSQRFLNDKVNSRDFLRSLKDACLGPIIVMIVIGAKFIIPIISFAKEIRKNLEYIQLISKHEIIAYFGGKIDEYSYYEALPIVIIMILCGLFVALSLFKFAFKKKSVNVYFSVGLTRTRLFVNRILAGAIDLFVASAIPFLIVFISNVALFGFNVHQLKLFAFYTFLTFAGGLAGLSIGAFAASVSGSIIEMVITSVTTSTVGIIFVELFTILKAAFLRGYPDDPFEMVSEIRLLTPWLGISSYEGFLNALITGKKVPKEYLITWKTEVFPIVFWIIVSIVIIVLGLFLFKKRKNENSNSFGKFDVSCAVNGATVFFGSAAIISAALYDMYGYQIHSLALCILLCAVGTFIIFFITQLIMRRNIKAVLRMLYVFGGLSLVSIGVLIVIGTGYFGNYNKLPDAKDIEYVSMSYDDPFNMFNYCPAYYRTEMYDEITENLNEYKSDNPEDIKVCIEQFNKIKKDKKNNSTVSFVSFVIKTKYGKFISRRFPVYSEDLLHDYNKAVFDSDYFHLILKGMIKNSEGTAEEEYTPYYYMRNVYYSGYEYGGIDEFSYFDSSLLAGNFNYDRYRFNDEEGTLTNFATEELINAVYNDLCKMTYDEYYGNTDECVGAIVTGTDRLVLATSTYTAGYDWVDLYNYYYHEEGERDDIVKTGVAGAFILVYPQMTETREQLKELEPNPHETAVKAVIYPDKKFAISNALTELRDGGSYNRGNRIFVSYNECAGMDTWISGEKVKGLFQEKPNGTYMDLFDIVYNACDMKVTKVDDAKKAKKIADASEMVYDTYGDNGRYVYVIYEDDCIVPMYLPEKSLSVLN